MQYRHFFWDFDGTLYDTYGRITRAIVKAFHDLGAAASFDQVYPVAKRSLGTSYATFAAPLGIPEEDFMARYHEYAHQEGPESIRPYAGAVETLRAVVEAGGKNYLYTHRGKTALEWLRYDGIDGLMADWVTALDAFPSKPAPDALNHLMQKHGLERADCVMIGDRDIDLDAGKNAGMACALFDPDGYYPDYDAPWRFKTMAELRAALVDS